uniref:Holliday junction branch migration complex subunit RuvA n=1 Tax=candidate division WOR-3 bacterium TaxID=2052148 RepID=A0A7C6EE33_UNCW3
MISLLRGKIIEKEPTASTIDCQGFGLRVEMPLSTSRKIGEPGSQVELYIKTVINREGISLYGFATKEERNLFNDLTQVPGIGPKAALNLLSRFETEEAKKLIAQGKVETLRTIPGIGPKKAEMIVFKLKEKIETIEPTDIVDDAVKALIALGISRKEAKERLNKITNISGLTLTEILCKALSNDNQ